MQSSHLRSALLAITGLWVAQSSALELPSIAGVPSGQPSSINTFRQKDLPTYPIVDSTFRLSTGDQLRLRWWGTGSNDLDIGVDTRGDIIVPDMARIHARGLTLKVVRDSLENLVRRRTKATLIDIQVTRVSQARVSVSGLVPSPGFYELPPGTRLSTLLAMAGLDPRIQLQRWKSSDMTWTPQNDNPPSLRRVRLIQGGVDTTWCDLAAALRAGHLAQDPPLFDGDAVQIQQRGPIAMVSGGNFPGGFEIIPGERPQAVSALLGGQPGQSIESFDLTGTIRSQDLPLDSSVALIRFPPRKIPAQPAVVWVLGKVARPGAYPLRAGATANDLVAQAGSIPGGLDSGVVVSIKRSWTTIEAGKSRQSTDASVIPEVRIALLAYHEQMNGSYADASLPLQAGDSVLVFPAEQVVWIGGAVGKQGFVPWKKGASIQEYIQQAGGLSEQAWADRIQVFDLHTGLNVPPSQSPRPGSAVVVPEKRHMFMDQWVGIAASAISLALTTATFLFTISNQ